LAARPTPRESFLLFELFRLTVAFHPRPKGSTRVGHAGIAVLVGQPGLEVGQAPEAALGVAPTVEDHGEPDPHHVGGRRALKLL